MSTLTATGRLEALKRSLEAARDLEHPAPMLDGEYRARHEYHMRGLKSGLDIAISAIEAELLVIRAGQAAAAQNQ